MSIEEAIKLIPNGNCILFVGSGFSIGAIRTLRDEDGNAQTIRSAWDVANRMYEEIGETDFDGQLNVASKLYLEDKGANALIDLLKEEFEVSHTTNDQKYIVALPWRRFYTTNYDMIVERAAEMSGKVIESVSMSVPIQRNSTKRPACVHLNGYISNLTPNTLENEFKLTDSSYNNTDFRNSPWFAQFEDDLIDADAVFFVGFSAGYDLDIRRTFQNTKELREKTHFIVYEKEPRRKLTKIEDFGEIHKINLSGFVELLKKNGIEKMKPAVNMPVILKSFYQPSVKTAKPSIQANDFLDLMSKGFINEHILEYSLREPNLYPYAIYRDQVDNVTDLIRKGVRLFMVQSDLGNGKSIFLESLALKLKRNGFDVFVFRSASSKTNQEIEFICTEKKQPVFIIDNYDNNIDVLRLLARYRTKDTIVILAERTSRYEVSYTKLNFFDAPFETIDVNYLTESEIKILTRLFDKYGAWGKHASLTPKQKDRFITDTCKSQLSYIIMSLIESNEQMRDKIKDVVSAIKNHSEFYQALLYILLSKYFGFNLTYSDLTENLSANGLNNPTFRHDPNICEFVSFKEEKITFKSSIIALHILKKQLTPKEFVNDLIRIFLDLDARSNIKRVRNQIKHILNYSDLNKIFSSNKPIFEFYENISECVSCRNHPHFWLQFAIARTSDKDFGNAKRYFDTSYSFAKSNPNYDTFQIDTHHAHYLLSRAIHEGISEDSDIWKIFKEAHGKLMNNKPGDEFRHYIYRVAADYEKFYDLFSDRMEPAERGKFKKACKEMAEKADIYLGLKNAREKEFVNKVRKSLMKTALK